jgi:hypothetical protein
LISESPQDHKSTIFSFSRDSLFCFELKNPRKKRISEKLHNICRDFFIRWCYREKKIFINFRETSTLSLRENAAIWNVLNCFHFVSIYGKVNIHKRSFTRCLNTIRVFVARSNMNSVQSAGDLYFGFVFYWPWEKSFEREEIRTKNLFMMFFDFSVLSLIWCGLGILWKLYILLFLLSEEIFLCFNGGFIGSFLWVGSLVLSHCGAYWKCIIGIVFIYWMGRTYPELGWLLVSYRN